MKTLIEAQIEALEKNIMDIYTFGTTPKIIIHKNGETEVRAVWTDEKAEKSFNLAIEAINYLRSLNANDLRRRDSGHEIWHVDR